MRDTWLNRYGVHAALLTVLAAAGLGCLAWWVPISTRWHVRSLASDSEARRVEARVAIARLGPGAVPTLKGFTADSNALIRRGVAEVLGDIGTDDALDALAPMTRDRSEDVRRAAVWALMCDFGTFHERRADVDLEVDHPDPVIRLYAVNVASWADLQSAAEPLLMALDDTDSLVRLAAARRLRALSHRSFDFNAFANADRRAEAVARWRAWWAAERKRLPLDRARIRARPVILGMIGVSCADVSAA